MKSSTTRAIVWIGMMFLFIGASFLLYVTTSSIRYGPNDREYSELKELAIRQDVQGINQLLLKSKSLSNKLIAMKYIRELENDSSIRPLVEMLSFDLPWYELLDTELKPSPSEVRYVAFRILITYGPERAGSTVKPLLSSASAYERLYAAGIMSAWGNSEEKVILDELVRSKNSVIREEALRVKKAVGQ